MTSNTNKINSFEYREIINDTITQHKLVDFIKVSLATLTNNSIAFQNEEYFIDTKCFDFRILPYSLKLRDMTHSDESGDDIEIFENKVYTLHKYRLSSLDGTSDLSLRLKALSLEKKMKFIYFFYFYSFLVKAFVEAISYNSYSEGRLDHTKKAAVLVFLTKEFMENKYHKDKELSIQPIIMKILNLLPKSFYDGVFKEQSEASIFLDIFYPKIIYSAKNDTFEIHFQASRNKTFLTKKRFEKVIEANYIDIIRDIMKLVCVELFPLSESIEQWVFRTGDLTFTNFDNSTHAGVFHKIWKFNSINNIPVDNP